MIIIAVSCYGRFHLTRSQRLDGNFRIEGSLSFLWEYETVFKGLDLESPRGLKFSKNSGLWTGK